MPFKFGISSQFGTGQFIHMNLLKLYKFQDQLKANMTHCQIEYNLHQKELTAEHGKDRQLILYPNCNISLKWGAQQGWVHLRLVMLQTGAHNASKTWKQVGKQIKETLKYCNELYQCTGQNTGQVMSKKYGN